MTACPTCKRILADDVEVCPRCDCDLSAIRAGERAARVRFDAGRQALREGRFEAARAAFARAWRWRHEPVTARARAVAALCADDYAIALRWLGAGRRQHE